MRSTRVRPLAERLWEKVDRSEPDQCWIWTGALDTAGYGKIRRARAEVRSTGGPHHWPAHRLSYTLLVGPILEGLDVDHLCRNRACVNPGHLEPVSRQVNVLRGVGLSALNALKTHCIRGHEFNDKNTRRTRHKDGGIRRECRACDRIYAAARRSRRKSAESAQ